MIKEPFILAENPPSMPGPGMVIGTQHPYFVGKVVQFKTKEEQETFLHRSNEYYSFFLCEGYRIGLLFIGTLHPMLNPPEIPQPSESLGKQMAEYYLQHKILKNASYFKRYKEER